jgi:ankyrin repeat protein
MQHAAEAARTLLEELDVDGSGELDFAEFCAFFSRLQRGDSSLRGFNALAAAMNETPVAVLEEQAKRRSLTLEFKLLEERAATSMHAAHYVVECTLTGLFYDKDKKGKPVKFVGAKVFQGIGKTTRDAREKCAQSALTKLRKSMPGLQVSAGELPERWLQWAHANLDRGVGEEVVLKALIDKGFYPAQNHALMQAVTVVRHLRRALEANGQLFAGEEVGDCSDDLDAFLDERLKLGFHGPVLLRTLEQFGFSARRNPSLVQRLKHSEVAAGRGWRGAPQHDPLVRPEERQRDWWRVCSEGACDEVELYLAAGQEVDARKRTAAWQGRTGLMAAAQQGRRQACLFLLQHHADPNLADAGGRTALHWAAAKGHAGCLQALARFGADAHLLDAHHNAPLHLAARHNRLRAAKCLLALEDDYQRRVVTGAIPAVPGEYHADGATKTPPVTFEQLSGRAFVHFLATKNHPKDFPRFRKDWVLEACCWVFDQLAPSQRRFVAQPSHAHAEYVLGCQDPDPDSGFYWGARGREVWVKTVESPELLLAVLTATFRQAANHAQNKLGRTALHEACYENFVDSHKAIIDLMVRVSAHRATTWTARAVFLKKKDFLPRSLSSLSSLSPFPCARPVPFLPFPPRALASMRIEREARVRTRKAVRLSV